MIFHVHSIFYQRMCKGIIAMVVATVFDRRNENSLNTDFNLKETLPTFLLDALVFAPKKTRASSRNDGRVSKVRYSEELLFLTQEPTEKSPLCLYPIDPLPL